jgi:hypothetical protein
MGEYEDLIARLREEGLDDLAATAEKYSSTELRKAADSAKDEREKREAAEAKIVELESIPKREEALRKAGVDFDKLRPADKLAIKGLKADDLTEDKVAQFVKDMELPLREEGAPPPNQDQQGGQPTTAQQIAAAARQSGGAIGGGSPTIINPGDTNAFAGWSHERLMKFAEMYPTEWEALKQGYEVSVPALPPELNPPPPGYAERWKEMHRTGIGGL